MVGVENIDRLANFALVVNNDEAPPLKTWRRFKSGAFAAPTHEAVSPQDSEIRSYL